MVKPSIPVDSNSSSSIASRAIGKTKKSINMAAAASFHAGSNGDEPNSPIEMNDTSMKDENLNTEKVVRLAPIKLLINETISHQYSNQLKLAKEIKRNFSNVTLKIKFVNIYGRKVSIVTDDLNTHNLLNGEWPTDAFEKGIIKIDSNQILKKNLFKINLINVHHEIDVDEKEIAETLQNQGIINPKRILKRHDGSPTNIITAEVDDRANYDRLTNSGIYIGYSRVKVVPKYGIKQCFRCFGIGHLKTECKTSFSSCMVCSGKHHSDKCPNPNKYKCANCGGEHSSVSRKCDYLKQANKGKISPGLNYDSQVTTGSSYSQVTNRNNNSQNQFNEKKITDLIIKIVNETFNEKLEALIAKAIKKVMSEITLKQQSITQKKQENEGNNFAHDTQASNGLNQSASSNPSSLNKKPSSTTSSSKSKQPKLTQ